MINGYIKKVLFNDIIVFFCHFQVSTSITQKPGMIGTKGV